MEKASAQFIPSPPSWLEASISSDLPSLDEEGT